MPPGLIFESIHTWGEHVTANKRIPRVSSVPQTQKTRLEHEHGICLETRVSGNKMLKEVGTTEMRGLTKLKRMLCTSNMKP